MSQFEFRLTNRCGSGQRALSLIDLLKLPTMDLEHLVYLCRSFELEGLAFWLDGGGSMRFSASKRGLTPISISL